MERGGEVITMLKRFTKVAEALKDLSSEDRLKLAIEALKHEEKYKIARTKRLPKNEPIIKRKMSDEEFIQKVEEWADAEQRMKDILNTIFGGKK
jgi:hypothetical protein